MLVFGIAPPFFAKHYEFGSDLRPFIEASCSNVLIREAARRQPILQKPRGNEMMYRVSYDDGVVREAVRRTEYYRTEFEALRRARQLLEEGDHHGIALHDGGDGVLTGIRLELKLGLAVTD